ncbi:glutathione-dependent formaldehyde-activating protein [Cunninghamella echinulata]|nr:glutathione-dependent formaldehyde-activating protein [Cunninghamella echinulata]
MPETITGGCLCEKIRYSISLKKSLDEIKANYCHCTMCRKASGSPLAAFFMVPKEDVTFSGSLQLSKYQSSENCLRGFCPNCGSQLTWERVGSDIYDFGLGTLDNPHIIQPQYHLWCENKIVPILNGPKYAQYTDGPLINDE